MPFTSDDRAAIKLAREEKGWRAKRNLREFPNKQWSRTAVRMLLRKIDQTSAVSRKPVSGRPRSVRSELNMQLVTDIICSQEDASGTGKSLREIEKETGISRSSVRRIAQRDFQLRVFKRKKAHLLSDADRKTRLERCRVLLRRRALQQVHKIWFSDEKIFTVQPPINT